MPGEAFFRLPGTTPPSVSLTLMYKQGTDEVFFEQWVCSLARFVTSLTFCSRAFLGSSCHLMCGPRLNFVSFDGGSYIDIGGAPGVHSATLHRALWHVIDAVHSPTRRRSHDSGPTARFRCHQMAGRGAVALP